jgi:hypothetical protein
MTVDTKHDDAGLDAVSPSTHPARDGAGFRAILAASEGVGAAEQKLREAVLAARLAGDSWTIIGAALGVSRQAAQQRFGSHAA